MIQINVMTRIFNNFADRCNWARHISLMMASVIWCVVCAIPAMGSASLPDRRFSLEFETGAVWQSRNEIQIPDNAGGTRFALTDLQGHGPQAQRRVEATWNIAHRHSVRFVYAPLEFPEPARSHRRCASQAGHLRRVPPWTPSISLIHIDLPTDIFFTSPKDGDSGSGQQDLSAMQKWSCDSKEQ